MQKKENIMIKNLINISKTQQQTHIDDLKEQMSEVKMSLGKLQSALQEAEEKLSSKSFTAGKEKFADHKSKTLEKAEDGSAHISQSKKEATGLDTPAKDINRANTEMVGMEPSMFPPVNPPSMLDPALNQQLPPDAQIFNMPFDPASLPPGRVQFIKSDEPSKEALEALERIEALEKDLEAFKKGDDERTRKLTEIDSSSRRMQDTVKKTVKSLNEDMGRQKKYV